ncbi:MAG: ethylbenzene dehydrogenase-related protein [Sulfurimonadaceae bacterium]|jgi:complex iron-sulfur molybdoenzyme family reductase subunit gamma|nr:ethylbenzene dehydrogenase-related protein [Sulfurimonadaceae bacterium]
MKKLIQSLLAASAIATAVCASSAITAVKVSGNIDQVSYDSTVWKQAKMTKVALYPQTTIAFNDKKANEINGEAKAIEAQVGAIYNATQIAFIIKWADGTKNVTYANTTDTYADGFAVQFATDYKDPKKLPYIGMGSDGRPVLIHLQKEAYGSYEPNGKGDVVHQVNPNQTDLFGKDLKAFNKKVRSLGNNDYEKNFIAEGFRSTTEIKDGSSNSYARFNYANRGWTGTLSRPLKDNYLNLNAAAIPVAFAVWDGEKMGRNGLKYLTGWTAVTLEGTKGSTALVQELHGKVQGDILKGKEVAQNNCSACHQLEATDASNPMGPSLTNIGGYSSVAYLRESVMEPSAVVVPGYNRNAHSSYEWYTLEENGARTSTMPDFSWLEKDDMQNLIAYLTTLKAEVKK